MTQKLDQVTSSTLSLAKTNTTNVTINAFPSAFEQPDIKMTLDKTALKPEQLTHIPNFENIPASTKRIKPLNNFLGQDRAKASVEAGISLPYSGYNIFAVGTAGLGKRTMIKRLLQQHAKTMPTQMIGYMFITLNRPVSLLRYASLLDKEPSFNKLFIKLGKLF